MFQKRLSLVLALWIAAALASVAIAQQDPNTSADASARAKQAAPGEGVSVGAAVAPGKLHRVSRPGLYGMSEPPVGSAYGIVDNRLIRFDPESGKVLSIIRQVDEVLD
ncbi:hypothetical protein [Paracoccus lutimaris]|uniref:Nickel/cobalt transporter regulator n=1 Tax=Paracoccus lutimaris TaxID=1490030 RepID=A0A368Z8C6_9RHOB|nr:hypothetical protein [Paracoccus lutimaris]RCW86704.1 hypothetical protein DFP89_10491 [Paracoccus lutimaris]